MGYKDENGDWIEDFVSPHYTSEKDAEDKIKAVIDFHTEAGWVLRGTPQILHDSDGYYAVIPLEKPAEKSRGRI